MHAALQQSNDVGALAQSFSAWIGMSYGAAQDPKVTLPVFILKQDAATLDAGRASTLIRTGVRAGRVGDLVKLFGLERKEDLGHALNTNNTSLWRWERDDKLLPGSTVEQILRSMQLQLFATEVFGEVEPARKWLHRPHPSLDGMTPSDYADNEFGAQKVRGMLAGLKYGGVA